MADKSFGMGSVQAEPEYGIQTGKPVLGRIVDAEPTEDRDPSSLYEKGKVRLSLDVSPELNELLESLARTLRVTKSDILRKAIVLMKVALDAKLKKKKLAIVDQDQPVQTEIVGLF